MECPAISLVWFKRVGKILLIFAISAALYIVSFFAVFADTFLCDEGKNVATNSDQTPVYKHIVGPVPSAFVCEGRHDRGAANGTRRFTGKEWPFVVYRPLVTLYKRNRIPEVKKVDDYFLKHEYDNIR